MKHVQFEVSKISNWLIAGGNFQRQLMRESCHDDDRLDRFIYV